MIKLKIKKVYSKLDKHQIIVYNNRHYFVIDKAIVDDNYIVYLSLTHNSEVTEFVLNEDILNIFY